MSEAGPAASAGSRGNNEINATSQSAQSPLALGLTRHTPTCRCAVLSSILSSLYGLARKRKQRAAATGEMPAHPDGKPERRAVLVTSVTPLAR